MADNENHATARAVSFSEDFPEGLRVLFLRTISPEERRGYENSPEAMAGLMALANRAAGAFCAALMIDSDPACQRYCEQELEVAARDDPTYSQILQLTFAACLEVAAQQGSGPMDSARQFRNRYAELRSSAPARTLH